MPNSIQSPSATFAGRTKGLGQPVKRIAGRAVEGEGLFRPLQHTAVADRPDGQIDRRLGQFHEGAVDTVIEEQVVIMRAAVLDPRQQGRAAGNQRPAGFGDQGRVFFSKHPDRRV